MQAHIQLGSEYNEHPIYNRLKEYAEFYNSLGWHTMGWVNSGTPGIININTYVFSSMQGTMESIHDILIKGRINDAYALLRKYYDSTMINVYTNIYLEDNKSIGNFIVSHINDWIKGKAKIPEYRIISTYILAAEKLKSMTELLQKDKSYKTIRERCNAHTHYNFYRYVMLNDNQLHLDRILYLDTLLSDMDAIFIQHVGYIFFLHDHYMMANDYVDSLDMGMEPDPAALNWVATFIQSIMDNIIKVKRPDIAALLQSNSSFKWE